MNATAEMLPAAPAASHRGAAMPRPRKPRRRAFRRSEYGRPSFVELDTHIANPTWEAKFWERYAIPGGMAIFGIVFVASNWEALLTLLGDFAAMLGGS